MEDFIVKHNHSERNSISKCKKRKCHSSVSSSPEEVKHKKRKNKHHERSYSESPSAYQKKKKRHSKYKRKKDKKRRKDEEKSNDDAQECFDVPISLMNAGRDTAPMTKEEWEKKQSVVKRVFDESSGRYRLIKGDGEVIEEIVTREKHKKINQQATRGDGTYFQAQLSSNLKK